MHRTSLVLRAMEKVTIECNMGILHSAQKGLNDQDFRLEANQDCIRNMLFTWVGAYCFDTGTCSVLIRGLLAAESAGVN